MVLPSTPKPPKMRWRNGPADRPTDRRKDPLIEVLRRKAPRELIRKNTVSSIAVAKDNSEGQRRTVSTIHKTCLLTKFAVSRATLQRLNLPAKLLSYISSILMQERVHFSPCFFLFFFFASSSVLFPTFRL